MEWIEGEPLYDWAARRNPTQRQALGWVLHVARALVATHAVGGLHRDVKGSNVLVRRGDGRAYLTDFGAGHYRGAGTLTSKLLPPGTHAYRSPEAWAFLNAFLRHPTVHYPASTCDDLFALGVMAYRLVTDTYPPSTQPGEPGAEVWGEGGSGPRRPSALNTRVRPQLDALILRLLAVAPVERFGGRAQAAVEALEQVVQGKESGVDAPLFHSGYDHRPCWRSPKAVRLSEERDAVAREQFVRRQEERQQERHGAGPDAAAERVLEPRAMEERERAGVELKPAATQARVQVWGAEAVVAAVALLLAGVLGVLLHEGEGGAWAVSAGDERGRLTGAVGDRAASAPPLVAASGATRRNKSIAGQQLPEHPLPGQRKPPCDRGSEVEIRGGCWYELARRSPCKPDAYEWKGACYVPSYSAQRQPTADPP
jgi:hypothetical protein